MTSKIIKREFEIQLGSEALTPRTDPRWGSFQNTYAAWTSGRSVVESITIRRKIELQKGHYYVTGTADNYGSVSINGGAPIGLYSFDSAIVRENPLYNQVVWHGGGTMDIVINAYNGGDVAGVAVTISEYRQYVMQITTFNNRYGEAYVGPVVWSTRSPAVGETGRFAVTMPFKASITAHAWGAGGGGGGMDAYTLGGIGSPGLYNTTSFSVNAGDYLEVFVGGGGGGGGGGWGVVGGGGPGGRSRISIEGNNEYSFNGGSGTSPGSGGYSGGGGGGGGASGVLVNNQRVLVAGGGGGGGGAGNDGNLSDKYARRDASIDINANGADGSDYRGQNGQPKSGDGGGGGGGGGGYPGGQGGQVYPGDASGYAGQCGGNYPISNPSTGQNSEYYKPGYADGGARGGGNGQNGRVVLVFQPISLMAIKNLGFWKQVDEAFIKVNDTWADIDAVFIKSNNEWRSINDAGQGDVALSPFTSDYGTSTRDFS